MNINAVPLAMYLRDFSDSAEPADGMMAQFDLPGSEGFDEDAVSEKFSELYAKGLADGREAAQREAEDAKTALEEQRAEALADIETRYADTADTIVRMVQTSLEDLRHLVADSVADILRPFLLDAVADRSVQALLDALDRVMREPETPLIEIQGPEQLVEAIAQRVRQKNLAVACSAGDPVDVKLRIGRSTLELQLTEWVAALHAPEGQIRE